MSGGWLIASIVALFATLSLPLAAYAQLSGQTPPQPLSPPPISTPLDTSGSVQRLGISDWIQIAALIAGPLILVLLWALDIIRPGSPRRAGLRDVNAQPWWVWLFAGIAIYLATGIGAGLAAPIPSWIGVTGTIPSQAIIALGSYAAALIATGAMLKLFSTAAPAAGIRIKPADLLPGAGWMLLLLPVVMASSLASVKIWSHFTGSTPDTVAHETLRAIIDRPDDPWIWLLAALAVLAAPLVEEVVFRGFLQSSIIAMTKSPWVGIITSAALFALIHRAGDQVPWYALVPLFILGLFLGLIFERTKRLGVVVAMHAAFNAANLALALLTR